MKSRRRKELAIIVASKAILQKNVIRRNKIGKTNLKVLHKSPQQTKIVQKKRLYKLVGVINPWL
jgi:hypothetical protein